MTGPRDWTKSSFSNPNGNCVEVRPNDAGGFDVRDSKNPDGGLLSFTAGEWDAFVKGVEAGEFTR